MSSSCKSVSGPIYGMFPLPEGLSRSPRQAGEISVGFIRRSCLFKMAVASLLREFSWLQFVVLRTKSQVFNTVNQKKNF